MQLSADALGRVRDLLNGGIHRTPVVTSERLSARAGASVFLKAECLQRTGSFKIRGALHFLSQSTAQAVVTGSSGNHGQAVASAARQLGRRATVVVPEDASPVKVAAIRGYGADVEVCGLTSAERLERARQLADSGALFVPPYDDEAIVAGQATLTAELLEEVPAVDCIVVPVGGGGLIAGAALAVEALGHAARIVGVETEAANDATQSFATGKKVRIALPDTIADGIRNVELGDLNWQIIQQRVDAMVTVSDAQVVEAMEWVLTRTKLVVEPTGAVALAAALSGKVTGRQLGVVLSGGNLDPAGLGHLFPES